MSLRSLLADERGVAAVIVAVGLPMLIGATAFAVDLGNSYLVRNQLQTAADAAALAAVLALDDPARVPGEAAAFARLNVPESYGEITQESDVELGQYDTSTRSFRPTNVLGEYNAVRVVARRDAGRGNAAPLFFAQIFGERSANISASAIAARSIHTTYSPPVLANLDNEAGDYNQIYAYCFDYAGSGPPEERRSQMTLIADNWKPTAAHPTIVTYSYGVINPAPGAFTWPECGDGESISFRLRNIRHAKSMRTLWQNPNTHPRRPEHNHYTDTVISGGIERFNIGKDILETVRCDTLEECRPRNQGGIIPHGTNRAPTLETRPCVPGKFMYFGWEDRPPGQPGANATWTDPAWTDSDYDDIVFVLACPQASMLGYGVSRIVE